MLVYSVWCAFSLIVVNGLADAAQPAGIGFVETVGSYLLARCYVRSAEDFYSVVQLLFRTIVFLLPFAAIEFVGNYNILREMFQRILPTYEYDSIHRAGFTRAMTIFEHPILFGVYVGSALSLTYIVLAYQRSLIQRFFLTWIVAATAALSVSAGPVGGMAVQVFLLSWDRLLRRVRSRWILLIGLLSVCIVVLEVVARRSAFTIITSLFVFDSETYWYRRAIWTYGFESVSNHPLFGIGLNDWDRPAWMFFTTIDNFWLLLAIRSGIPAPILLIFTFLSIVIALARKRILSERLAEYRAAFVITLIFFFLVGWTVHFWGTAYVLFLFVLASGIWILDDETTACRKSPTEN